MLAAHHEVQVSDTTLMQNGFQLVLALEWERLEGFQQVLLAMIEI